MISELAVSDYRYVTRPVILSCCRGGQ